MPYKDPEKMRAYQREWKRKLYAEGKTYTARVRKWLREYKEANPCADCGRHFPYYVMEFDHINGTKVASINIVRSHGLEALHAEMAKCELVCANCHRVRTHERRQSHTRGGVSTPS